MSFRVVDALGQPKQGVVVSFALLFNQDVDGVIGLARISSSPTAITNNEGVATVTVVSGTLPVSPRVKATFTVTLDEESYDISSVSSVLGVGTGMPHQSGFSIALSRHNVEGGDIDSEEITVTASLADHFGNPVPDGTSVTFVSPEAGNITSNCTTEKGRCSSIWRSSGVRPVDNRLTITAYATGEDSFHDSDGNGIYSGNPDYITYDMPEPFVDANENGVINPSFLGEQLIDVDLDGVWDSANGIYDGLLCDPAVEGDLCSRDQVQVAKSQVIALSHTNVLDVRFCTNSLCNVFVDGLPANQQKLPPGVVYVCTYAPAPDGLTLNPVAAGSTITFSVEDPLKIVGRSSFTQGSTSEPVLVQSGAIRPAYWNYCNAGKFAVTTTGTGPLRVEVTTGKGSFAYNNVMIANP